MNRNIYKYLYAVLLLSLALLPTGCISDGEGLCPEPDNSATSYITFRVIAPKTMAEGTATRTVPEVDNADNWNDNYLPEEGVDFDNALIGNQFNVFITSNNGTQITRLQVLLQNIIDSNDKVEYSFSGKIPQDDVETLKTNGNARIHVAANSGSYIPQLNGELSFSHAGQPSETFTAIPMWGVGTFNFTTLQPGNNDVGEIWLLRAMAKVEIIIDDTDPGNLITSLTSASVTNANTQGYVLPQAWSTVANTKELSFEKSLNALPSVNGISGMAPADNKIVFYLPETANTDGTTAITLNYTTSLTGNESKSNVIKFAKYENGIPSTPNYDIVRNHLYRFNVSLSGNSEQFEIKYTVCPWNEPHTVNPPTFD